MKALSLWQPWASLVALGAKTIETRSWSTSHRGPLAIHAAKHRPVDGDGIGSPWDVSSPKLSRMITGIDGWSFRRRDPWSAWMPLPLGVVVATCTLVDVLPIIEEDADEMTGPCVLVNEKRLSRDDVELWEPCEIQPADIVDGEIRPNGSLFDGFHRKETRYDERPYGEFTSGRYAWILDDIEPCDPPIPAAGRQGLWTWEAA